MHIAINQNSFNNQAPSLYNQHSQAYLNGSSFQAPSPLGQRRPGLGQLLGGIVGAALGQMMMPIPFLGAMLGGLIGSMLGSMMDNILGSTGAPCACHNMGQHYGPMNQDMAANYGYPQDISYLPQGFYNPSYGAAPPLFPQYDRPGVQYSTPQYDPPVAQHLLPQVSVNPVYNNQKQNHTNQTTRQSKTAVALVGKNNKSQENTIGHNQGRQVAVNVAGVNEQKQSNQVGNNSGSQTAIVQTGVNKQTQENKSGNNEGRQVAITVAGANQQEQVNQTGDNTGNQTAVVIAGSNTQNKESVSGSNAGHQTATTIAGRNTQTQKTVQGDNGADQYSRNLTGPNLQKQESTTGDNTGSQSSTSIIGSQTQEKSTVSGDNSGPQKAKTSFGAVTQYAGTTTGSNTGPQKAATGIGDVSQTSHSGAANRSEQTASTAIGDAQQIATGGDNSKIEQTSSTVSGDTVQAVDAGANSRVEQTTHAGGKSLQEATVASGVVVQKGAEKQVAASRGGPIHVAQHGAKYGETTQQVRGSDQGDVITQKAGQGTMNLFDDDTAASVELGGGNDTYKYEGNSESNHVRIDGGGQHAGADRDTVRVSTHGGSDTAVVNLSGGKDNYHVDLGRGSDQLVVNEKGQKTRILDSKGKEIYRSKGWSSSDGTARTNGMEKLSVYREDGSFAKWNNRSGLEEGKDSGRPGEMSPVGAARLFREHAGILDKAAGKGSVDGIIGASDLKAALNDPAATPELKQAIQYSLDNPAVWKALDASGAGSNRVKLAGLNDFIDGYESKPGYDAQAPMNNRQAARVLNHHSALLDTASGGSQNSKFNEDDLRAIASGNNSGLPTELRSAARRLLNNNSFAKKVDNVASEAGAIFDGQRTFSNADLSGFRG